MTSCLLSITLLKEMAGRSLKALGLFSQQILQKLKSLALETEAELERQDEALDSITTSVDRATLNIDKQNRRMKKLT